MKLVGVILAAGKGTRMGAEEGSEIPKVMYEAHGRPLIGYCLDNLRRAGIEDIVVVVGYKKEIVMEYLDGEVKYALQEEQLGTGHAVKMAEEQASSLGEAVLVCYGDMPLFKTQTIKKLIEAYQEKKPAIAMLTAEFKDPFNYGRIVRNEDGNVIKNVEEKDCTEEEKHIKEINPCFYIFNSEWLWENLKNLQTKNAQHEYYLTDLIEIARIQKKKVIAIKVSEENEAFGVNTQEQLQQAGEILEERAQDYVHI